MQLKVLLLVCFSGFVVEGLRECGKYGSYNKLDAMHRILVCLITDFCDFDIESSKPEILVKTTKQLINKSGKSLLEFRKCGWSQVQRHFPLNYQTALNESKLFTNPITSYCSSREEICKIHKEFLYPVVCLLETKCDRMLSKLLYAFLYGIGQLNVETESYLRCDDGFKTFDVNRDTIFETNFCHKIQKRSKFVLFY